MTPWPEALQRLYPAPCDVVPNRPWWRHDARSRSYIRSRGSTDDRECNDIHKYDDNHVDTCAFIDKVAPLSHPGIRTGQIWADANGVTYVVPAGSQEMLQYFDFQDRCPFLLADPICPHLAPWAPVEKGPDPRPEGDEHE